MNNITTVSIVDDLASLKDDGQAYNIAWEFCQEVGNGGYKRVRVDLDTFEELGPERAKILFDALIGLGVKPGEVILLHLSF